MEILSNADWHKPKDKSTLNDQRCQSFKKLFVESSHYTTPFGIMIMPKLNTYYVNIIYHSGKLRQDVIEFVE